MNKFSLYSSHQDLLIGLIIEFSEFNTLRRCIQDINRLFFEELNILYIGKYVIVPDKRAKWFSGDDGLTRTKITRIYDRGLLGMHILTEHGTYHQNAIREVLNE